jgi:hypothetical protein
VFSVQIQAQVQIPSQERVETLLEQIEDCKNIITEAEKNITLMEKNPESYTLPDYIATKNLIEQAKSCIKANRKELDSLRQGYSGWFNSPNATMPLGRGHDITPRELENKVATIEEIYADLLERFEALEEPED